MKKAHRNKAITPAIEAAMAKAVLDEGKTLQDVAEEFGVGSVQVVKIAVAKGRVEPNIDPATLSLTAQKKFDIALRQATVRIEAEYEAKFRQHLREHFDGYLLPKYRKLEAEAQKMIRHRKGVMKLATYRLILRCLHPDHLGMDADPKVVDRFNEATRIFTGMKAVLVAEDENPTALETTVPKDWNALREKVRAENSARSKAAWAAKRKGVPA